MKPCCCRNVQIRKRRERKKTIQIKRNKTIENGTNNVSVKIFTLAQVKIMIITEGIILTILLDQAFMTSHIIVGDSMIIMLHVDGAENLLIATIDTIIVVPAIMEDMMDTTAMMIIINVVEVAEERKGDDLGVEVMNHVVGRDEDIDTSIQIDMITAQCHDLNLREMI